MGNGGSSHSHFDVGGVAPNIAERMYLFRPIMAEPPLCSLVELKSTLDICDLADLHEVLDIKQALQSKKGEP